MNDKIVFEKFNYIEEVDHQRDLFKECFPENLGTPVAETEHYNWKFRSFPTTGKQTSYEYVAKLNNEMIGYYAAVPYEYKVGGRNYTIAMVCDVMTGVKARGKGVFTKLGLYSTNEFANEGLAFSTGYPIRPEVIPGHKKAGWDIPFKIQMYGKFIKMDSFLVSRNKQFLIPAANFLLGIHRAFTTQLNFKTKDFNVEVFSASSLGNIKGLDLFFEKWKNEHEIVLNKTSTFLKWRLAAPEKEYNVIVLRKLDDIVGYSVVRRVEKEGVPCLGILDLAMISKFEKNTKLIFKKINSIANENHAELLLIMFQPHMAKSYGLVRNGFIRTPYPFSFIIKQFDKTIDSGLLSNEKNWSLAWIDSDDL